MTDKPTKEPLPFKAIDAWRILDQRASAYFIAPDDRALTRGLVISIQATIRVFPSREEWEILGDFIHAGGISYAKDMLGPSWIASAECRARMVEALDWHKGGRINLIQERREKTARHHGFRL